MNKYIHYGLEVVGLGTVTYITVGAVVKAAKKVRNKIKAKKNHIK